MFGLLDNLFSDDPKKQAMMQMAMGLLGGAPNSRKNFGADLAHAGQGGLLAYGNAQEAAQRRAREQEASEMRRMQMEHMRRQNERQGRLDALPQQFSMPGNLTPNDDMGNAMPPAPQGFNMEGYAQALAGIDPQASLGMRSQLAQLNQREKPKFHVVGGALVPEPSDPSQPTKPVYTAPEKPDGPKVGQIREIKSGGNIHTYEWDGKKWTKIADAPQFAPHAPEKGQYDAERGVLIDPRTGQAKPVMQDGKPIGAKPKEPAEGELTAAGYAGRMMAAEQLVGKIGEKGLPTKGTVAMSMLPLSPEKQRFAERQIMSPEQQTYRQAQEDWVRAKLRKESGAVIAEDEMKREIETYFPQLGDAPETIRQKALARATAIRAMQAASGKATKQASQVSGGWSIRPIP